MKCIDTNEIEVFSLCRNNRIDDEAYLSVVRFTVWAYCWTINKSIVPCLLRWISKLFFIPDIRVQRLSKRKKDEPQRIFSCTWNETALYWIENGWLGCKDDDTYVFLNYFHLAAYLVELPVRIRFWAKLIIRLWIVSCVIIQYILELAICINRFLTFFDDCLRTISHDFIIETLIDIKKYCKHFKCDNIILTFKYIH